MPRKKPTTKQTVNSDQKVVKANSYLETQKEHKDWYNVFEMGKQRGKPKSVPPKIKKEKGFHAKHKHKDK
jgi:hypothetical protein